MIAPISADRVRALLKTSTPPPPPATRQRTGPRGKLTDADVYEIRAMRQMGSKQEAIANRFGIGRAMVSMICSGQRRVS